MICNTGDVSYLRRKDLSMKAKGLLTFLLTLPEDYPLHKTKLKKYFKDGQSAINSAFDELMMNGYIIGHKTRVKGHIDYDYDVCDIPYGREK